MLELKSSTIGVISGYLRIELSEYILVGGEERKLSYQEWGSVEGKRILFNKVRMILSSYVIFFRVWE